MSETLAVVRASRPNFLILAPLCAGLGVILAWQQGEPPMYQALLVVLGALLAHAAVNLLNEYQDFTSGLDTLTQRTPFSGGSGALPERPTAASLVRAAALASLALVMAIGLYFFWLRGWPVLVLGGTGLALVLTYTRWITRLPLLCLLAPGLGFGPVMILGTLTALGARPDATAIVVSAVVLVLVSELLLINQIPDAEADQQVGRRHLVVLHGAAAAARLVGWPRPGSFVLLGLGVLAGWLPMGAALGLIPLPAALWISASLPGALSGPGLHRLLAINVAVLLSTLVLLMLGLSL